MQRIFVGDIQGCADEFDELLERARVEFGAGFEIWAVGDLVNRGPDNLRVLTRLRDLVEAGRARVVLGNHDLGLLRVYAGLRELKTTDTYSDVLNSSRRDDWIEWLRARPLVATDSLRPRSGSGSSRAGSSPRRFAMVHASVHPDWGLTELEQRARGVEARLADSDAGGWRAFLGAREDPDFDILARLVSCRSVVKTGTSEDGRSWSASQPQRRAGSETIPWHHAWSDRHHDYGIVYGHWARQGLHVEKNLRGLDTGCVHHGRGREGMLTAWLPDENASTPFGDGDDRLWQIPARRAYYAENLGE